MSEILPKKPLWRKLAFPWRSKFQEIFLLAVIVLVGVGAFGLGRLSALREQSRLTIHAPELPALAKPTTLSPNNTPQEPVVSSAAHNFVASKNGSKYYSAGCAGAKRIKAQNEVWFETASAAVAAGYSAASGCAGVQ